MTSTVEFAGLEKVYGQTVAVADVTQTLVPGEVVYLLGPNGAGKTTTLCTLAGLVRPTGGDVRLHGGSVLSPEIRQARRALGSLPDVPDLSDDVAHEAPPLVPPCCGTMPA